MAEMLVKIDEPRRPTVAERYRGQMDLLTGDAEVPFLPVSLVLGRLRHDQKASSYGDTFEQDFFIARRRVFRHDVLYHIHEEVYIGNDADAQGAILWQVGAKFEATKSHVFLNTKAYVSFAINEAGQYG